MNKFLFFFFLFHFLNIHGQNFKGGFFAGITSSQVSGDELSGFNKFGPSFGIFVKKDFDKYKLKVELLYTTKGSKRILNFNELNNQSDFAYGSFTNYNFHLDYIGVPVLIILDLKRKFEIELGSSFDFLINQSEEIEYYIDNSRKVKTLDLCIIAGIKYSINEKIDFNARLSNSILPIRPHASGQVYRLNKGQYNTTINLSLHYNL